MGDKIPGTPGPPFPVRSCFVLTTIAAKDGSLVFIHRVMRRKPSSSAKIPTLLVLNTCHTLTFTWGLAHQTAQGGCLFRQAICQPTMCLLLRFRIIVEQRWVGGTGRLRNEAFAGDEQRPDHSNTKSISFFVHPRIFCRPFGSCGRLMARPRLESLGYFRESLRDVLKSEILMRMPHVATESKTCDATHFFVAGAGGSIVAAASRSRIRAKNQSYHQPRESSLAVKGFSTVPQPVRGFSAAPTGPVRPGRVDDRTSPEWLGRTATRSIRGILLEAQTTIAPIDRFSVIAAMVFKHRERHALPRQRPVVPIRFRADRFCHLLRQRRQRGKQAGTRREERTDFNNPLDERADWRCSRIA